MGSPRLTWRTFYRCILYSTTLVRINSGCFFCHNTSLSFCRFITTRASEVRNLDV